MDNYGDLIDDLGEMEPELDWLYNPCCDLSRIGMPDWCACPWNCWWAGCACRDAEGYRAKYGLYWERCGCGPGITGCGRCCRGQCHRRPPLPSTYRYPSATEQKAPAPKAVEAKDLPQTPKPSQTEPAAPEAAPKAVTPPPAPPESAPESAAPEFLNPETQPRLQPQIPPEPDLNVPPTSGDQFLMPLESPPPAEPSAAAAT